jgi:hypothetical protein
MWRILRIAAMPLFVGFGGLLALAGIALVTLKGKPGLHWLELLTLWSFGGLLTLAGICMFQDRWLSEASLEGLRAPVYRPKPVLRLLLGLVLLPLGTVLVVAGSTVTVPKKDVSGLALCVGGFALAGAFIALFPFLPIRPAKYLLVREGLLLRHRLGDTLFTWDRIRDCSLNDLSGVFMVWVGLVDPAHEPLPSIWRPNVSKRRRRRWLDKTRRNMASLGFLLITEFVIELPPGIFLLRLQEALANPEAREQLPSWQGIARNSPTAGPEE